MANFKNTTIMTSNLGSHPILEKFVPKNLHKIVGIQFKGIQCRLAEQGITLETADEMLEKLAEEGYESQFGARPLKRVLQRWILNQLSKEILAGSVGKDAVILMELGPEGEMRFENVGEGNLEE